MSKNNDKETEQCTLHSVKRICFKQGDKIKVGDRLGEFHRYGATKSTAIAIFDEGGLSFCDEDSINYA